MFIGQKQFFFFNYIELGERLQKIEMTDNGSFFCHTLFNMLTSDNFYLNPPPC